MVRNMPLPNKRRLYRRRQCIFPSRWRNKNIRAFYCEKDCDLVLYGEVVFFFYRIRACLIPILNQVMATPHNDWCVDCAVRFFVSLYKSDAGIPAYFKEVCARWRKICKQAHAKPSGGHCAVLPYSKIQSQNSSVYVLDCPMLDTFLYPVINI